MVSGHQFDSVNEDLSDQGSTQEDDDEPEQSPGEQVHFALPTIGVYGFPGLGAEQPEHDLADQHHKRRQSKSQCVEQWVGDVHVEVFRLKVWLVQVHITTVEDSCVEWED